MKNYINLNNYGLKFLIKSIFLITILFFFILFTLGKIKIEVFFCISSLFFINFFVMYAYLSSEKENNYIPIYPLIISYYLLTYSAYFYFDQGISFYHGKNISKYSELLPYFILVISLGIIFFSLGYFLPNYYSQKKEIKIFKEVNKYQYILIFFFILILLFYYINYPNYYINLGILNQLKEPLILFLLIFLQIKYFHTKKYIFNILNILLLIIFFILELSFGAVVFPYLLVACYISISYYKKKTVNIITVFLIFVSLFFVHTSKEEIRKKTWEHTGKEKIREKILLNNLKVDNVIVNNVIDTAGVLNNQLIQSEKIDYRYKSQQQRLFHSNISLQIVIALTPKEIDFFNGVSYRNLKDKFIPRFINKNKSQELWGNFWGKRYKILLESDNKTSWNFPVINEFYANFGIKGVVIGMFFWGLIIKALIIGLNFNSKNIITFCAAYTILFNFFFQENNLTMILGRVINEILFFGVIIIFILLVDYFFYNKVFRKLK